MGTPMDRSNRLFGRLAKFEEVYPELEDAILEWVEESQGVYRFRKTNDTNYDNKVSLREYGDLIHCSNGLCRQGGFELGFELSSMVRNKETVKEGSKICAGSEGSPKLRRVYRKCLNGIDYKITLIYKNSTTHDSI
jgi:hypothetical protein